MVEAGPPSNLLCKMCELGEEKGRSQDQELGFSQRLATEIEEKTGKTSKGRKWFIFALLFVFLISFVGLQLWGADEFRKSISQIEKETQKLDGKLKFLENTAGDQNILLFLKDIESLDKQCQEKIRISADFNRKWWFVLPFFKKETVTQELHDLQMKMNEIISIRPTIEVFARRLEETDNSIAGVVKAIGTADVESMIVELASFTDDSEVLRKDIERTKWPSPLTSFKETFLTALDEREAALNALLAALDAMSTASVLAKRAAGTYLTAWSIWDYQEVLNYLEASDKYSSQAEGYMAEFEFHTARYLKLRDRLLEKSTLEESIPKEARI